MRTNNKRLQYINSLFGMEDELLEKVRETAPKHLRHLQLSTSELQLLSLIIKISGIKRILEIGTFVGTSAVGIAKALPKCGMVYTIEKSERFFTIAKQNFKNLGTLSDKIVLQLANALEVLNNIDLSNIDAIFIDAAKAEYPEYLKRIYQKLRSGTLIIADNTMIFDEIWDYKQNDKKCKKIKVAMMEFNSMLSDKSLFETAFIPTYSGMSLGIRK